MQTRPVNAMIEAWTPDLSDQEDEEEMGQNYRQELKRYTNWKESCFTTTMFRELIKRLQAFGLIYLSVESNKITENQFVRMNYTFDELRSGFEYDEIYQQEKPQIDLYLK